MSQIFIIERDFGKLGAELSGDREHTLRGVIDDIVTGQTDNVIRVLEIHTDENRCQDVTEDVARACLETFLENRPDEISLELLSFFHEHVGLNSVPGWLMEAAE